MYRISFFILFFLFNVSCSSESSPEQETEDCTSDYTTAGILVNISKEIFNDDESVNTYSKYSWSSDNSHRILNGNGIPNHEVGTFPNQNNPNTIREQNVSKRFSLCPEIISESGLELVGPALAIAYALNSVKFDPGTAGRCNDAGECSLAQGRGNWNIEALGHDTFDFGDDMNHANDSTSEVIELQSSYKLKSQPDANRPNTLTALLGGPGQGSNNLNRPIEMGAFTQDYEYVEGLGDLDQCNGRFGVTPEFPNGIYYYVVSDDFPFFTRCLKGKV